MLESLRNNMKLLKSSKRHVLLFELAYKLLALAVFYPVITGVIRLCMRITGINYLTNEYIAKAFMNPVIIIFCLLGVIGFIVYCLYEMAYLAVCFETKRKGIQASIIDNIYNAEDYYVDFFDESKGVVVCGYAMTDNDKESYKIYKTDNGGENWTTVGSGPANYLLKGIIYVDENVGFFCFNYIDGMDGNLYITKDGGKTFSKVVFPEQELDSTARSETGTSSMQQSDELKWSDVYKEALVPVVDDKGVITVYVTQGSDGTYNDGKTAAKYQSSDKGESWVYISQLEITKNQNNQNIIQKHHLYVRQSVRHIV